MMNRLYEIIHVGCQKLEIIGDLRVCQKTWSRALVDLLGWNFRSFLRQIHTFCCNQKTNDTCFIDRQIMSKIAKKDKLLEISNSGQNL